MHTTQSTKIRAPLTGLAAAKARGSVALDKWVSEGIVLSGPEFAVRRGVSVQAISAAVRRGDLFSKGIRGRRYYVASLLDIEPAAVAAVCRGLAPLDDAQMAIFWLRPHGALGAKTAVMAILEGRLELVVQLAVAQSAQASADAALLQRE
jgi:hypothetical protein